MDQIHEDEEIPIPLVVRRLERRDRMSTGGAGGVAGFLGGAAALAAIHALEPELVLRETLRAAEAHGVELVVAVAVAYLTCASVGALVGAAFAGVTRYLRRWVPLLVWAVVFFVSVAIVVVATARAYGAGPDDRLADAILAASAAFAVVVSLELPLRRASST